MGTMISYTRPDGQSASGYLAEPANATGAPLVRTFTVPPSSTAPGVPSTGSSLTFTITVTW